MNDSFTITKASLFCGFCALALVVTTSVSGWFIWRQQALISRLDKMEADSRAITAKWEDTARIAYTALEQYSAASKVWGDIDEKLRETERGLSKTMTQDRVAETVKRLDLDKKINDLGKDISSLRITVSKIQKGERSFPAERP